MPDSIEPIKPEEQQTAPIQLVVFRLDDEEFAVKIEEIREVIMFKTITPMPDAPKFLRGVTNVRGEIVLVIDLKEKFMFAHNQGKQAKHIIITKQEENLFGLLVDEVTEILRIHEEEIKEAPELLTKIHKDYVKGVVVLENAELGMQNEELEKTESKIEIENEKLNQKSENENLKTKSRLIILLDFNKILTTEELVKSQEYSKQLEVKTEKKEKSLDDARDKKEEGKKLDTQQIKVKVQHPEEGKEKQEKEKQEKVPDDQPKVVNQPKSEDKPKDKKSPVASFFNKKIF